MPGIKRALQPRQAAERNAGGGRDFPLGGDETAQQRGLLTGSCQRERPQRTGLDEAADPVLLGGSALSFVAIILSASSFWL